MKEVVFFLYLVWVTGFGGSDTRQLGAAVGKAYRDQNREEGTEATLEGRALNMPVLNTVGMTSYCTRVNQDTTDDEDNNSHHFEDTEPVLDFTVDFLLFF